MDGNLLGPELRSRHVILDYFELGLSDRFNRN